MHANGFRHFLYFAIFSHSNSNISHTNMPMLRKSIRGKCFSSLFWNFYFCSYENGVPKTIVDLIEILDAIFNCLVLEIFAKIDWGIL